MHQRVNNVLRIRRLTSLKLLVSLRLYLILSLPTTAQAVTQHALFDFDGDIKTDLTVYRPSASTWYIFQSQTQTSRSEPFGVSTDRIVPGDYAGDGEDELERA